MIRAALKTCVLSVLLAVTLYGVFFVPLGERTLWEHLSRIAATEEAQDLGREADQASERFGRALQRGWESTKRDGGP